MTREELINLIKGRLTDFDWGDYGLDLMVDAEGDWADDLAVEIAVALSDKVEVTQ